MKKLGNDFLLAAGLCLALAFLSCNRQPTDKGQPLDNEPPETFFAPKPLEGSMNNSFKLRLEWHGNDRDGIVQRYEYRVEGPLYDNTWQLTESFFVDFKFRDGWYTVEVRAIDNAGTVDPTPAQLRFHVLGPTFDRGLLLIDDDNAGGLEAQTDAFYDSLLIGAGYTDYTVWDYREKFATMRPVFTTSSNDTGATVGLGAFTSIIWLTHAGGNLGLNERTLQDYLDMGGNILVAGDNPLESITGESPTGTDFPTSGMAYKYFQLVRARSADLNLDWIIGAEPTFPDLRTFFQIPNTPLSQYLRTVANQLVPLPNTRTLYLFSTNHYSVPARRIVINSEEFAGTPIAIFYEGDSFNTALFGFPLAFVVRAGPSGLVNLVDPQAMTQTLRYLLEEVFAEPK